MTGTQYASKMKQKHPKLHGLYDMLWSVYAAYPGTKTEGEWEALNSSFEEDFLDQIQSIADKERPDPNNRRSTPVW